MAATPTLESAISAFGSAAKQKLTNLAVSGNPEDQLRAPFERLLEDLADLNGIPRKTLAAVGESSLSDLKTRPDYAVAVGGALVGFVELKAPGKGADPRKFTDPHDKAQWARLQALPNILYSDGNGFTLWQNGELVYIVPLSGNVELSGAKLEAPTVLVALFGAFLKWKPIPPRSAKELAITSARLCRFLRDEVTEQLALKSEALTALAKDWRMLLFPEATDLRFADGYAQAVTFGLLMARAKGITLAKGLERVAAELTKSSSLIGAALRLLTDDAENQATLKTSLGTLTRVLDAVDWPKISKGEADAWLYFYEDFLEVYDNELRKLTGSYYTPPQVVGTMVRLVDDVLRGDRFGVHAGLASPAVTLADPATGTGTFLLGVLRKIAANVEADEGAGSVPAAVQAAVHRLIAFEMQLGPFAVAQLRVLAELAELSGAMPMESLRMFVTNTLGNPYDDESWIPALLQPIARSRKEANKIKREQPITVVIGNPPYKEKAMGLGGWIERATKNEVDGPLTAWIPPPAWGISAHAKHLRNLYVYFWRWATWKVFDFGPGDRRGIVCFITVAGFLGGQGFQKMRDYLRRTCDDIWVIDCSPERHQPEVNTRIFQGVQQPVCIVLASRSPKSDENVPASVHFRALPAAPREEKFTALASIRLSDSAWIDCPTEWRAPFLPASHGAWATYPALQDLFVYNGSGVQAKRTWVMAPDAESLKERWQVLIDAPVSKKEDLFHPTLRDGKPADRHVRSVVHEALPGYPQVLTRLIDEKAPSFEPVPYGFRSFNRQWIIPDPRVITQPNAELWTSRSGRQVFITAPSDQSPTSGPALTLTGLIPDLHHYNGRGGRVFPLWRDAGATEANLPPQLLPYLEKRLGKTVSAEDLLSYIAAVAASPAFTERFQDDLSTPGLRVPITADPKTFTDAATLGRTIIWLHSFGERMVDAKDGRAAGPPRLTAAKAPRVPKGGAIPSTSDAMPDTIDYDPTLKRLAIGTGFIENVEPAVWSYEVSRKQVLVTWFSYRKKDRERPMIGNRRQPSSLGDIQPDHWLPEYTTELLNVLNVLGWLVELEPQQAALLERICAGPTITETELRGASALEVPAASKGKTSSKGATPLFDV